MKRDIGEGSRAERGTKVPPRQSRPLKSFIMTNHKNDVALNLDGLDQYGAFMAFSLRGGGVSSPPFDSLNFSAQEGDSVENVDRNFRIFGDELGIDPQQIITCHQIHGDGVVIVSDRPNRPPEADAIISTDPNIYPAVKTADCVQFCLSIRFV